MRKTSLEVGARGSASGCLTVLVRLRVRVRVQDIGMYRTSIFGDPAFYFYFPVQPCSCLVQLNPIRMLSNVINALVRCVVSPQALKLKVLLT
jgi:hypothetical protein